MARIDPLQMLPLFLPKERTRLLMIGWHPSMLTSFLGKWKEIEVYIDNTHRQVVERYLSELSLVSKIPIRVTESINRNPPTAVVAIGVGPFAWTSALPREVLQSECAPLAAIARGRVAKQWIAQLPKSTWVMEGLPVVGTNPSLWIPADRHEIPWSMFSPRGRFIRPWMKFQALLRRFGFPVQPWTFIVNRRTSIVAQLIYDASPTHTAPGYFWYHTRNNSLLVFLEEATGPGLVMKIPLDTKARVSLQLHQQGLSRFRDISKEDGIGALLPNVNSISSGDFVAGVEQALPGISAFQFLANRRRLREIMRSAAEILVEWQKKQALPVTIDSTLFEKFWERPLQPLQDALEVHGQGYIYTECLEILKRNILGKSLPLVPVHGDFWLNNLLWDPERRCITGVLDWDESCSQGLPLLDLFHLLFWRTHYLYDLHSEWTLVQTLKRGFPGEAGDILRNYCTHLNIQFSQLQDLFCRYWLGEAARKIDGFVASRKARRTLTFLHQYLVSVKNR